jgi:hypothetical protein
MRKNRAISTIIILMIIIIIAVLVFMLPKSTLESFLPQEAVNVIGDVKNFFADKIEELTGEYIDTGKTEAVKKHYSTQNESSEETAQPVSNEETEVDEIVQQIRANLDIRETTVEITGASSETVNEAVSAIYKLPYYFWLDREYRIMTLGNSVTVSFTSDFEDIDAAQNQIDSAAAQILSGISEDTSDYRKARAVYEGLINSITYNKGETDNTDLSIYGALVEKSCVCEGYAKAFVYLMEKAGLSADIYTGTAVTNDGTTELHAWNSAVLYGQLYYFDVTWADQDDGGMYYDWFALTSEQIGRTHFPDEGTVMPYSDATDCNYYYLNEMVMYSGDEEELKNMIIQQGYDVDLMCASQEAFNNVSAIIEDPDWIGIVCQSAGMIQASGYSYLKNDSIYTMKISFY